MAIYGTARQRRLQRVQIFLGEARNSQPFELLHFFQVLDATISVARVAKVQPP
jgi:hypothetical protein